MILLKTIRRRRLKFKPKLATTMRPHGKWGDLLACLIPISWCINILLNSNFLLKLIEWQNESSLFTIRIRGKQWYWVYKLDFKNFTNIITAPKNIGHGKWVLFNYNSIKQSDDYLSAIQLRKQTKLVKQYWADICNKQDLVSSPMNTSFYETVLKSTKSQLLPDIFLKQSHIFLNKKANLLEVPTNPSVLQPLNYNYTINRIMRANYQELPIIINSSSIVDSINTSYLRTLQNYNLFYSTKSSLFEDNSRFYKRADGIKPALKIYPTYISDASIIEIKDRKLDLLVSRFNSGLNEIEPKPKLQNNFMVMKQKRYKRRKTIKDTTYQLNTKALDYYKTQGINTIKATNSGKLSLSNNQLDYTAANLTRNYKFFMKNKVRSDETNIGVSRRMIRTKRTLVLPAHVNLTAITNSYDVIHSWFIPGLGLKMDCIPGRSTHHTFYIDNVGFYYGQCAEVCGRYHHHMPIRICALPFDHFLLWWHHFGIPKLIPTTINKCTDITYGLRKYVW